MLCKKCGKQIPNDSKLCPYCGAPAIVTTNYSSIPNNNFQAQTIAPPIQQPQQNFSNNGNPGKKKASKKKKIIIAVCVFLFVGICVSLGSNDDNSTENAVATTVNSVNEDDVTKKTTTKASTTEEPTTSTDEYKSSCDSVAYKDIARNPDQYNGKNVKFTGKVIQVQESYGNNVVYRISVTKDEYDFWDDTVYVTYKLPEGSPNILEDDIVTFYGECKGTKSYTSVLGSKVTIPEVDAKYIVIDKEG
ncbi:MAG: zinc ribbon domain-containing protein [Oscillospiraceae bacterium]|nr:zinc ribbon domain-containing protein [Oscillospiraceae bacterium]